MLEIKSCFFSRVVKVNWSIGILHLELIVVYFSVL